MTQITVPSALVGKIISETNSKLKVNRDKAAPREGLSRMRVKLPNGGYQEMTVGYNEVALEANKPYGIYNFFEPKKAHLENQYKFGEGAGEWRENDLSGLIELKFSDSGTPSPLYNVPTETIPAPDPAVFSFDVLAANTENKEYITIIYNRPVPKEGEGGLLLQKNVCLVFTDHQGVYLNAINVEDLDPGKEASFTCVRSAHLMRGLRMWIMIKPISLKDRFPLVATFIAEGPANGKKGYSLRSYHYRKQRLGMEASSHWFMLDGGGIEKSEELLDCHTLLMEGQFIGDDSCFSWMVAHGTKNYVHHWGKDSNGNYAYSASPPVPLEPIPMEYRERATVKFAPPLAKDNIPGMHSFRSYDQGDDYYWIVGMDQRLYAQSIKNIPQGYVFEIGDPEVDGDSQVPPPPKI